MHSRVQLAQKCRELGATYAARALEGEPPNVLTSVGQPSEVIQPPEQCDFCEGPFGNVFYDVKTHHGPWANLCHTCFIAHTPRKLGTNHGRKFKLQRDGRWERIGG